MLCAELGVTHALYVGLEVVGFSTNLFGQRGVGGSQGAERENQFFYFAFVEPALLVSLHPGFLLASVVGKQQSGDGPQVLAGVIQIDDLNRAGKMLLGQIPDPLGTVAEDDFLLGAAPAAIPGFQVQALGKRLGSLNGAGLGGGIGSANRIAFLVSHCLREHASELDLTRAGRLPFGLALAPGGFFFYHRHSGSIHFYVQNRNRLAHDDR